MRTFVSGVFAATLAFASTGAIAAEAAPSEALSAVTLHQLSEQGAIKANQLLVKFKQSPMAGTLSHSFASFKLEDMRGFYQPRRLPQLAKAMERWRVVTFAPEQDMTAAFTALNADPAVEYVVPNRIFTKADLPNDPLFDQLWGLHNTGAEGGTPGADISALDAWRIQPDAEEVVIAVIDTGVDYTHPDLAANMWVNPGEIPGNGIDDDGNGYVDDVYGYNFVDGHGDPMDDQGHGTHVAGTIAAVGNNGIGITGVAPRAKIMALKFLDAEGYGFTSDAIDALLYAADMGARISNNSWGSLSFDRIGWLLSRPLEEAIRAIDEAGHLVVAAAGNDMRSLDENAVSLPGGYNLPNVVSVAASDRNDKLAVFSNYGVVGVDLAAPGMDILSTVPGGGYESYRGTSMATPHVSGAAALLLAKRPDLTPYELRSLLMNNVDPVPALEGKVGSGGRLNLHKALSALVEEPCEAFTATVAEHISAGRAHACGLFLAYGCANGSNENLGSRYGLTPVTLLQQGPNHYVTGSCSAGVDLPPTVFIEGETDAYVLVGGTYTPPAATAVDREDGDLTGQIVVTGQVDTQMPGWQTLRYDVTDSAGNPAVTARVRVQVLETDTPPRVELFGRACLLPLLCSPVLIEQHTPFVEDGYLAWDELDGDLTDQVTRSGTVLTDTSSIGHYKVKYDVVDSSGQHNIVRDHLYRSVFVLPKEEPAIFKSLGHDGDFARADGIEYSVALGTTKRWLDEYVIALDLQDNQDNLSSLPIETEGEIDYNREGTYRLIHSTVDSDGNTATAVHTVHVVRDVTPPQVTLQGEPVMYVKLGEWFRDPGVTASDDLDPDVHVRQEGTVDTATPGTYQIRYWAVDESGNVSDSVYRTVIVQGDCEQYSATVQAHIDAGRAYTCGSFGFNGCAVGSGDDLGNRFLLTPVVVREEPVGSGMFYKGACQ